VSGGRPVNRTGEFASPGKGHSSSRGVASSQPTPIIINPPTISMVAAMKTAVSDGVIIQLLRMVRPQLSDVAP
jgi:hypothetical protein